MSKPWIHAKSSVKKWGGVPDDSIAIHEKMDASKMDHAELAHRCVFHSAFGINLIEELFGRMITIPMVKKYSFATLPNNMF